MTENITKRFYQTKICYWSFIYCFGIYVTYQIYYNLITLNPRILYLDSKLITHKNTPVICLWEFYRIQNKLLERLYSIVLQTLEDEVKLKLQFGNLLKLSLKFIEIMKKSEHFPVLSKIFFYEMRSRPTLILALEY